MNINRFVSVGLGMLVVMGGLSWASAGGNKTHVLDISTGKPVIVETESNILPTKTSKDIAQEKSVERSTKTAAVAPVSEVAQADVSQNRISLVPPPEELPRTSSKAMVTSVNAAAPAVEHKTKTAALVAELKEKLSPVSKPANKVVAGRTASAETVKSTDKSAAIARNPNQAMASAKRPGSLFSYVRMLNFSPHPNVEEFMKDKPMVKNGKNYWFSVKYLEDWHVINDEEGCLKGLGFEIDVYENDNKIKTISTPKYPINSSKLKKGQVLGTGEAAPYKFTVTVSNFTLLKKAVSELEFKLELQG